MDRRSKYLPRGVCVAFGAWLFVVAATANAVVQVEADVDTAAVYVGDIITYRIIISYGDGDSVAGVPHGVNLYSFHVRDYRPLGRERTSDGRWREGSVYKITAYRPGTYVIPPIPIEYRTLSGQTGELVTQPLTIVIKSLGVTEGDTLRGLKPPVEVPASVQRWIWVSLSGVAGAALLGVSVALFRRGRKRAEIVLLEPAVVDEVAEFDEIPADGLISRGEVKELYVLVSEAMRLYVGRRYRVNAMELTCQELVEAFRRAHVSDDEAALFREFLERCDLVKFAKCIPPDEEIASLIERAKDLVRRTDIRTPVSAVDTMERTAGEALAVGEKAGDSIGPGGAT